MFLLLRIKALTILTILNLRLNVALFGVVNNKQVGLCCLSMACCLLECIGKHMSSARFLSVMCNDLELLYSSVL